MGLMRPLSDEFSRFQMSRSSMERIDGYVSILRSVISSSSLCYIDGELAFFDGRAYSKINHRVLSLVLSNILPSFSVGASDARKIGDMPFSVIFEKNFSNDSSKVCFSNCIYDIVKSRCFSFDSKHITDYKLNYSFLPTASCPKWESFLAEVLPDASERACLQEFFGMCYIDRDKFSIEKMAFLIGSGSNGKSVVFDVMKNAIGIEWVSFLSPDQLMDNRQLVSVAGKKLNFAPDIKRSSAFDSGLKALSSSQDVQGWRLYQGNVIIKCPPLVFAFNEMPHFKDDTDAFFRRLLPFQFDVVIPPERQNRKLASDICKSELSGIFLWIMAGRTRLLKNKGAFTKCGRMEKALTMLKNRIRGEQCPVLAYLDSIGYATSPQFEGQPFEKVTASSIYNGLGGRISKDAITRELNAYHVKHDRGMEVRYFLYKINNNKIEQS